MLFFLFITSWLSSDSEKTVALREALKSFDAGRIEQALAAVDSSVPHNLVVEGNLLFTIMNRTLADHHALLADIQKVQAQVDAGSYEWAVLPNQEFPFYVALIKALQAFHQKNEADFETHIKDAFWAQPAAGPMLQAVITDFKSEQRLANVRVPLDQPLNDINGKPVILAELAKGKKFVLLDFWAAWCRPCLDNMPELKSMSEEWGPRGVLFASINLDTDPSKAAPAIARYEFAFPCLVDPREEGLDELLGIDSIPRAILVNPEGKVLYNGHPGDPKLAELLKKELL
ncbi:MAG: TlpA family protein disulfide reductase [Acidobacteria bacterium]|nr:TlpA family protein disulfide reductase [Acidobacteriota bacterium]MCB9396253.1 TlpA family protein disulfide reductase [Acidobacteriota bacterium]